jgi:hypothetical protein
VLKTESIHMDCVSNNVHVQKTIFVHTKIWTKTDQVVHEIPHCLRHLFESDTGNGICAIDVQSIVLIDWHYHSLSQYAILLVSENGSPYAELLVHLENNFSRN